MYAWTYSTRNIHKSLQRMMDRFKAHSMSAEEEEHLGSSQLGALVGL